MPSSSYLSVMPMVVSRPATRLLLLALVLLIAGLLLQGAAAAICLLALPAVCAAYVLQVRLLWAAISQ